MFSALVKKCFPIADRVSLALNCCSAKKDQATLLSGKEPLFKFEEEFKEPHQKKLGLRLTVNESGSLQLDPNVIHPFVRVHVMDMQTCKYLAKSDSRRPGSYNTEAVGTINTAGVIEEKDPDFLMPLATKMYDMRVQGQS